ncbi:invasion associated locus B family protein [Rhizobium sp. NTR19]|uniref:Invasion associated locus B family protein n=1 Tax=Neorhizobium turbinariae TaxID=2937795 RepID=A0ABT0IQB6_9HYPH|nr:invasion associated locus B family protein [Neorhizobium turbinariae]MCK8780049.1 invasion associated locus B family protein [Neorhizobium turbinariae]
MKVKADYLLGGNMARTRSALMAVLGIAGTGFWGLSTAYPQSGTSGPMFSTPASRSTTGAPILNNSSSGPDRGIIDSAGGGTNTSAPAEGQAGRAEAQAPSQVPPAAKRFAGWELQCVAIARSNKVCQITSSVTSPDGSQIILVMSIAKDLVTKALRMQMAVPLGIAIAEKVGITVVPDYETSMAVNRCTSQGCLVEGVVEPALVKAIREGEQAIVTVTTPEGKRIPIALGLKGVSAALDAMTESEEITR